MVMTSKENLHITSGDPSLYNADLTPIPPERRSWGAIEIFNVWNNDTQSLFGYALAASLFLSYGLNGWLTFAAIVLSGLIVMWLVNLPGRPSVRYGVPYGFRSSRKSGSPNSSIRSERFWRRFMAF